MTFTKLPRDTKAQIVRDLAAQGLGRRQIAERTGAVRGSIDSLCHAYRIKTDASRAAPPQVFRVHPGWERDGVALRAWFMTMDKKFRAAMAEA